MSGISEDKMEAFYASIEAEPNSLLSPPNTVSVRNRPSEETQKALRILRDLVTLKFSLLLHPGRSVWMKYNLKYLVYFSRGRGFSLRTKSILLQLSACFAEWKKQVFDIGRLLKAERDDLRNQGPRLKAEQELTMITQAYIEAEWSKLGEQFIESVSSEEWMKEP